MGGVKGEEEEVKGRCWVRRAAMREDVKSWTCVRISRPNHLSNIGIVSSMIVVGFKFVFSLFFFFSSPSRRKRKREKKGFLGSFRGNSHPSPYLSTYLVSIHLAESYSKQPITRQNHTQHLPQ